MKSSMKWHPHEIKVDTTVDKDGGGDGGVNSANRNDTVLGKEVLNYRHLIVLIHSLCISLSGTCKALH